MYELKKIGKIFTSKFVGTGPSSYEKRIYRATVSRRLRNPTLVFLLPSSVYARKYFILLCNMPDNFERVCARLALQFWPYGLDFMTFHLHYRSRKGQSMLIKIFLKTSQLNEKHLLLVQQMPTCVPGDTGFHMHFRRRSFKFKTTGASIETVLWN
jgi:hypothetical protein